MDCAFKCSKLNYGMTYKQFRQLTYGCGRRLQRTFSCSWNENKIAGIDWLLGFVKRHKKLTLRKPGKTILFRPTEFTETNLIEFFDNCECALKSWNCIAGRAYNIDENGVSTVVHFANFVVHIVKNSLMIVATPGSLWLLNSPQSRWIAENLLLNVLELAKKFTRTSKIHRIILLMDNNDSHLTLHSIGNFSSPLLSSIRTTACRGGETFERKIIRGTT